MSTFKKVKNTYGFTLIELLVVIAIIGILSSVVLASLNGARQSSRDARRQTDLQQIRTSLSLFRNDCGEFPSDGGSVTDVVSSLSISGCSSTLGDHMTQIPKDPSDGDAYRYAKDVTNANADFCLGAHLESTSDLPDDHAANCLDENGGPLTKDASGDAINYAISG